MSASLKQRLHACYIPHKRTLLGVGPMSHACVASSAELAAERNMPLMLIASRRQVEAAAFGGGYVENWSTEEFSRVARSLDPQGNLVLCRDHGGAYQGTNENTLTLEEATKRAKESYAVDIASGFGVIHIDPSLDPVNHPTPAQIMERACDLLSFCWGEAQRLGKDIVFEIGTEEQTPNVHTPEEIEHNLLAIQAFCVKENIPMPLFVVAQTGTKVMEAQNVGLFEKMLGTSANMPQDGHPLRAELAPHTQLPALVAKLNDYGVFLKQHNTDYLTDASLKETCRLGVHAANVAPEYGVVETRSILKALESNGLQTIADRFLQVALDSGKWGKWMMKRHDATDRARAEIAGHYVFATPAGREVLDEASRELASKGIDLAAVRHDAVKASIQRYLMDFGW